MGTIVPNNRWPEAKPSQKRSQLWFPIAFVAVFLGGFSAIFFAPFLGTETPDAEAMPLMSRASDTEEAYFPICTGSRRITCVVDGDTIWYQANKIRIADLNTPEVGNPECAAEKRMGNRATIRMQELLNSGAFTLAPNPDGRDMDTYGRKLRLVTRGGKSLSEVLIEEGLAERWGGMRIDWC